MLMSNRYIFFKINLLLKKTTIVRSITLTSNSSVGIVLSSSGTSQLGMFDIQATTKSKYYDHIVYYILNPEDVAIGRLFLFVFTYMFLWLT